jgi:hypothetical protein
VQLRDVDGDLEYIGKKLGVMVLGGDLCEPENEDNFQKLNLQDHKCTASRTGGSGAYYVVGRPICGFAGFKLTQELMP